MNINDYNRKCQELARLTEAALELEGLDSRTRDELRSIRENILANHYRITLLGAYQGGKSTIFDTACGDGRELSPTGYGIRTSAVPAEAHAIGEDDKEYALVTWKSNSELLSGFIEAIGPEVRDLAAKAIRKELAQATDSELVELLDLASSPDRSLLEDALNLAQKHYDEERAEGFAISTTRYELLRIGKLILRYIKDFLVTADGSKDHRTTVTVEEASRIVRFPVGWERESDVRSLKWHDVRFLFARAVAFHVASVDLSRLKAVLVDCPGFHASKWDNDIVHECIAKSDAIIWLQGTEGREMSLSDIEEARKFGDYGITHEGIFVAFNSRGTSEYGVRPIVESNIVKMRQELGLKLSAERIPIFNALLSLRAKQALALASGQLRPETIETLSEKALNQIERLPDEGRNIHSNAKHLIERDLQRQALQFLDESFTSFDSPEAIEELMDRSGWNEVIEQAAMFVVKTKGHSRLINRGAQPILDAVSAFEQNLRSREQTAQRSLNEHQKAKEEAERALVDFESKADGLLRPYERNLDQVVKADDGIGNNIRGELLGRFTLDRNRRSLAQALEKAVDSANQEREVCQMVRAAAREWMKRIITGWHNDVRANNSSALRAHQIDEIEKLQGRMKEFLERAVKDGGGLLGGTSFTLPEIEDQTLAEYEAKAISSFPINKILDKLDSNRFFHAVRDGYEWVRQNLVGERFSSKAWKKKLPDYQDSLMGAITSEVVNDVTKNFLKSYFQAIVSQIDQTKRTMREEYEARVHEAEQCLEQSEREKRELANHTKNIRKKTLRPFRAKVEQFIKETEKVLTTSSIS